MKIRIFVLQLFTIALLSAVTTSCDPIETGPTKIDETTIFTTKYTKDKVWDAFRSPAYPVAGSNWQLYNLKAAIDDDGEIDFGTGRYVQFVAVEDNKNIEYSIVDDLYNIGSKYSITLNLHESNGTLVKVISRYGQIIGIGDKGFMYVAEGYYGMFFPIAGAKVGDTVTYSPTTATVTKLSELYK
jgi:hypothetical protein